MWTTECSVTLLALMSLFLGSVRVARAQPETPTPQQISNFRESLVSTFVNDNGGPGTSGGGASPHAAEHVGGCGLLVVIAWRG